jgi:F-type H+-transporting ATPase subunit epsilon
MARLQLIVLLPTEELVNTQTDKIVAEAVNGSFCLLPRHIDFVAALLPGVLCYQEMNGTESFVGIDEGVLVKCGQVVTVSTINGVLGTNLADLRALMESRFETLDQQERKARAALARLEASTLRGFWESRERMRE